MSADEEVGERVLLHADGHHVVQGDDVIVIGMDAARRTLLDQPHRRVVPASESAAVSLDPRSVAVPYLDRAGLLDELTRWSRTPQPVAVHMIEGRAGTGKTRLAIELARRLDADGPLGGRQGGWLAGMLSPGATLAMMRALQLMSAPRLVIVDDAADRVVHVKALLRTLAQGASASAPVRILLLARPASADADRRGPRWADALRGDDAVDRLLDAAAQTLLDDVPLGIPERAALLDSARTGFVRPGDALHALPAGDLHDPMFAQPLAVVAGAFLAAREGVLPHTLAALSEALLACESRYWQETASRSRLGLGPDALADAVALATLTDTGSVEDGCGILRAAPNLAGLPESELRATDAWLRELYPPGASFRWGRLEPQALGEHLVAGRLGAASDALEAVLEPSRQPDLRPRPLALLTRLALGDRRMEAALAPVVGGLLPELARSARAVAESASREPELLDELPGALAAAIGVLDGHLAAPTLRRAADALPLGLPSLSTLALAVDEALVAAERRLVADDPAAHTAGLAAALDDLSARLAEQGRHEEAVERSAEAVRLYGGLAEAVREAHTADVARALTHLADLLSRVGRPEEAIAPAEDAAELCRALSLADPAVHLPELARALNTCATLQGELGETEEALGVADEAIGLYRRLLETGPLSHASGLAAALSNRAILLVDLGRTPHALAPAEEAIGLRRRLVASDPGPHTADLADALNEHALLLAELGRRPDALDAVEEAVALRRLLAGVDPDGHAAQLAEALQNKANRLADLGRRSEVLAPAEEAVGLLRRLADADPARYAPELARALHNYAIRLAELGRRHEALAPAEEAVVLRRRLAQADPAVHAASLAGALNNYAIRLAELGRREDALGPAEEMVALRRRLAESDPDAQLPQLAGALSNYAIRLAELERSKEALAPAKEAVALRRRLAETDPAGQRPHLAAALNNYANRLMELGRHSEAAAVRDERRRLA